MARAVTSLRTSNENGAMITLIITCSLGESVRRELEGGGGRKEDSLLKSGHHIHASSHTESLEANSREYEGIAIDTQEAIT